MNRILITALSLSLLVLTGCPSTPVRDEVPPDSNTGGDDSLAGARGLFDFAVADSVSASEGDNTDVKYFDIAGRGTFDLRVRFFDPSVSGTVSVLNEYGDLLRERSFADEEDIELSDFQAMPGRYYARIHITEGSSDYSIGREFHPDPTWMSQDDRLWLDDQMALVDAMIAEERFDQAREVLAEVQARFPSNAEVGTQLVAARADLDEAERADWQSRADDDDSGRDDDDDDDRDRDDGDDGGASAQSGDDGDDGDSGQPDTGTSDGGLAGALGVQARIITLRDRGAGLGTILVMTGCGSSSGLEIGSRGRIEGTAYTATITGMTGADSCHAESDRRRGEVVSATFVEF